MPGLFSSATPMASSRRDPLGLAVAGDGAGHVERLAVGGDVSFHCCGMTLNRNGERGGGGGSTALRQRILHRLRAARRVTQGAPPRGPETA